MKKLSVLLPGLRLQIRQLYFISIVSILLLTVNLVTIRKEPHTRYQQMIEASQKVRQAIEICQDRVPISGTFRDGLLGPEFSPITTTIGNLPAKQTALNPDFAALFIYWFDRLDLAENNQVVIQISGSFPVIGMSAVIACETMKLKH